MNLSVWTLNDGKFSHVSDIETDNIQKELEKIAEKYGKAGKLFVLTNGSLQVYDGSGKWDNIRGHKQIVAITLLDYAEKERYFQEEARTISDIMMEAMVGVN